VFRQDLVTVIDCYEQAFDFFSGCPRRVVIDGMKACLDNAHPCTPRFNRTFLEYAHYRGFLPAAGELLLSQRFHAFGNSLTTLELRVGGEFLE
jgi:transposase